MDFLSVVDRFIAAFYKRRWKQAQLIKSLNIKKIAVTKFESDYL